MAGCFDFRMRASSLDMHQLAQRRKLAKFSKLFRSKSDSNVKTSPSTSPVTSPKNSPKISPSGSPSGQPRRRFMRVVRDAEKAGEEYENPHLIRRYTQEYVEQKYSSLQKSTSLDESQRASMPYTPQEDSILKKGLSLDTSTASPAGSTGERSPPANKHASFKEEVEIIEYDKKVKIQKCVCLTHKEKLHDDSDSDFLEELSSEECELSCDKENTKPEETDSVDGMKSGAAVVTETADCKSLKDSSLKNIVNSEKAVDRDAGNDSGSDGEQQPIKKSKRHSNSEEGAALLSLRTKTDEDLISAKQLMVSKDTKPLDLMNEDDAMASSITKVHIDSYVEKVEEEQVVMEAPLAGAVAMVKAEL